jgi:ADP-ribose pyrophosphatase
MRGSCSAAVACMTHLRCLLVPPYTDIPYTDIRRNALDVELCYTADRFRVERVTRRLADGRLHARQVIRHPGAVVIVPVLDDGRICLLRNYRVAVDRELLELPAGTLEPPEPPLETARRELIEETGYRAGTIEPLCDLVMSPGILDERMFVFVARQLEQGEPAREVGEEMTNLLVTLPQVDQWLESNQIQDAKTVAALLYFLRYRST